MSLWQGRRSHSDAYLHEKVECVHFRQLGSHGNKTYALLGYACDEGVKRNFGRPGARQGPDEIRRALAKLANHLDPLTKLYDTGDIECDGSELEAAQQELSEAVFHLLGQGAFPIVLGGGHDIAYGHYSGIRKYLNGSGKKGDMGIINLDAHFDLRTLDGKATSGTPFYQIAEECRKTGQAFHYLCLGVQPLSNIRDLYHKADELGVQYIEATDLHWGRIDEIREAVRKFSEKADHLYLTIDMDGFSAAMAPGVSAPSPLGFEPRIAVEVLRCLVQTDKLASMDIAELNPQFDIDGQTARLAAHLVGHLLS